MLIHIYIFANVMIKHEKSYGCIQKIPSNLFPNPQSLHPKTSCRFLRFRRQKPTFPLRKTYISAPGNVRFPIGKHRKHKDIFHIIDQRLNKKGWKPPDSQPSTYRHQYKPNPPASQIAIPRQRASTSVHFSAHRSHTSY